MSTTALLERSGRRLFDGVEGGRALVVSAAVLWIAIYVMLHVGWPVPVIDHLVARALRRILTCGAGFGLSLAMLPWLARMRTLSTPRLAAAALLLSLAAQVLHTVFRLAVFHFIDPLWGPPTWDVVLLGLQGVGWAFPMWCAISLAIMADAAARRSAGEAPPIGEPLRDLWRQEGRRRVRVPLEEVTLFSAEDDYVRLWTASRQYLVRGRLKEIAAMLPEDRYMRVHRSAIIRLDAVQALEPAGSAWRVRLSDGAQAQVSRAMGKTVRQRLAVMADDTRRRD